MSRFQIKDITGKKFNTLTALSRYKIVTSKAGKQRTFWEFRCDCGKILFLSKETVIHGLRKSCGCQSGIDGRNIRGFLSETGNKNFDLNRKFYNIYKVRSIYTRKRNIETEWKNFTEFKNLFYKDYIAANKKYKPERIFFGRKDERLGYTKENIVLLPKSQYFAGTGRVYIRRGTEPFVFYPFRGQSLPIKDLLEISGASYATIRKIYKESGELGFEDFLKNGRNGGKTMKRKIPLFGYKNVSEMCEKKFGKTRQWLYLKLDAGFFFNSEGNLVR